MRGSPIPLEQLGRAARFENEPMKSTFLITRAAQPYLLGKASVLIETDRTLGVLPLGTLNHFAKDLNIPLAVGDQIHNLLPAARN